MPTSKRSPTALSLALAVLFITVYAAFGPTDRDVTANENYVIKAHWERCTDVVVAGDSTTLEGIDPSVLESHVPGVRVANFSIQNSTYDRSYLDGIDHVLDPGSAVPVVLLGLDPFNTNPGNAENDVWKAILEQRAGTQLRTERTWLEKLDIRLKGRSLCAFLWGLCQKRRTTTPGPRGVIFQVKRPFDPTASEEYTNKMFKTPAYSVEYMAPLFERVKAWRARGARVLGVVMPASDLVLQHMKERGYSAQPAIDAFVAAGGVLLDAPTRAETYDGVHLTPAAAEALSRTVGEQLGRIIEPKPRTLKPDRCPWPK